MSPWQAHLSKTILAGLILTTFAMTPDWSIEPFNLVKMLILFITSVVIAGSLLLYRKKILWSKYRQPLTAVILFNVWLIVVVQFSHSRISLQIYGQNGRNTGFLTYCALSLIFLGTLFVSNDTFIKKFSFATLFTGVFSLIYGFMQAFGIDPYFWVKNFKGSDGFQGNPNFQSSLLGILGVIGFSQLFLKDQKTRLRVFISLYLFVLLFGLKVTESKQGYLVFIYGVGTVLWARLFRRSRALGILFGSFVGVSVFATVIGLLNKGPLASVLYGNSISARGDSWRAGWRMTTSNPIFGLGLDSFGDSYLQYRDSISVTKRSIPYFHNASHNVFLDISSSGGVPLLLIYCFILVLVIVSSLKVITRSKELNPIFMGLVGAWVGYLAQSIISINQISLAMWGWVISGLIIGYEVNSRRSEVQRTPAKAKGKLNLNDSTPPFSIITVFIACIFGFSIASPPFVSSVKYKTAIESNDLSLLYNSAYLLPLDPQRMVQVSGILNGQKSTELALEIAKDAVLAFPNSYLVWTNLYYMDDASFEQKEQAKLQMKRLDPLGIEPN
jgi:O-antigen ligase